MALEDPYSELSPEERLKNRMKAYSSQINIAQPMQQAKRTATMTPIGLEGLRGVYKGATEGGFMGRQAASTAVDQAQLEMAKASGGLNKQQDALNLQGAQMKEDIVGTRQQEALNQFKRQTADMEAKMDTAIAERSFELGMTSKELAFHTSSRISDLGFSEMQKDYNKGNISKQELETVKGNLAKAAQKFNMEADALLRALQNKSKAELMAMSRSARRALQTELLAKKKEAVKAQVKAGNIAAIISGTFTLGGAAAGALIAGPGGASLGASVGGGVAPMVSSAVND